MKTWTATVEQRTELFIENVLLLSTKDTSCSKCALSSGAIKPNCTLETYPLLSKHLTKEYNETREIETFTM